MRLFSSLERKDAATRRATSSPYFSFGFPYYSNWSIDRAVKDGYERVIWVYRAINAVASNASRLPIELRSGTEDGPLAAPQALNRLLNRRANPFESAAIFRYRLSSQLLLSKKGVFVEVVRDRAGRPAQLTLLPPAYTWPIPDRNDFISGFRVDISGQSPEFVPYLNPAGLPNVLWIRLPHPTDPYSGSTPMESAGISIDLDYYARLYNRTFLQNDGRPGGILAVGGEIDEEDGDELKRRFNGNGQAGRVSVIEADDVTWVDTAVTPRDAQYIQGRAATKEDILIAFGVPESVIGNASGRTYDNADAERLVFWQETMLAHLDLLSGFYDFLTEGGIDDDVYVRHNTTSVDVLQRAKEAKEKHNAEMIVRGLKSPDEGRESSGLEEYDVPGSRSLYLPKTLSPIAMDEDDALSLAPPAPPTPILAAVPPLPGAEGVTTDTGPLPTGDAVAAAALGGTRWEKAVEGMALRLLQRQEKVVLERLRGTKALKHTRYWDASRTNGDTSRWVGDKTVDPGYLLNADRWDAELAAEYESVLRDVYAEAAAAAGLPYLTADSAIAERAAGASAFNAKTREGLAKAVNDADFRGADLDGLAERVKRTFSEAAAWAPVWAADEAAGAKADAHLLAATTAASATA